MRCLVVVAVLAFPEVVGATEPKLTAHVVKVKPPEGLAEPIRAVLDESALVVRDGHQEVLTLWFRAAIPVQATPEQVKNGLTYQEIPEGELVGVIRFPAKFTDYRKQQIPAGVYTLRFALQPDIGDHTGTSPHPEFCLMCPAEKDSTLARLDKDKLIELSSRVNEGRHPAVLLLWPYHEKNDKVQIVSKGNGVLVAQWQRAVVAGEAKTTLGFAITVAGQRPE
ncbi:MAG: hypothetical protein RMJ56_03395 [Gemmataceae bacterium]|nr:hypothetical protein [Gemmata sp.]MDW8196634.1 hypothetical protein [Gemmataceae bacterium]